MSLILIGGGLLLILIAVVFAITPVLSYVPIPVLGDVIDFPIGVVIGLIGVILIVIGLTLQGLAVFISEFWWLIPLVLVVWVAIIWILYLAKKKLRGR